MNIDQSCRANPIRPRYHGNNTIRVLPGAADVLVSSAEDRAGEGEQAQRTMPRIGDLIRSDPASMARRREQLEAIEERPEEEQDANDSSLNSEGATHNGVDDQFTSKPCDEDAEPARRAPGVYQPTAQEYEDHRCDHIPYRNWCPFCVKARATGQRHSKASAERKLLIIGMDYMFLTPDMRILRRDELESLSEADKEAVVKMLLIREHSPGQESGCIFGSVVPQRE